IEGGVADEHVDLAECLARLVDQRLQLFLVIDVAGNGGSHLLPLAVFGVDVARHLLAGVGLAARHHDIGAVLGKPMHDGFADALGGTGDEAGFSGQIEKRHGYSPQSGNKDGALLTGRPGPETAIFRWSGDERGRRAVRPTPARNFREACLATGPSDAVSEFKDRAGRAKARSAPHERGPGGRLKGSAGLRRNSRFGSAEPAWRRRLLV